MLGVRTYDVPRTPLWSDLGAFFFEIANVVFISGWGQPYYDRLRLKVAANTAIFDG